MALEQAKKNQLEAAERLTEQAENKLENVSRELAALYDFYNLPEIDKARFLVMSAQKQLQDHNLEVSEKLKVEREAEE